MSAKNRTSQNGGSLKRLQPAVDLAERSSTAGQQVYESVKARLPQAAAQQVEKLESAAAGAAAPLLHKAQDTGAGWRCQRARGGLESAAPGLRAAPSPPAPDTPRLNRALGRRCALRPRLLRQPLDQPAFTRLNASPPRRLNPASPRRAGATLLQAADSRVDAAASRVTATYERNAAFLAEQVARQKEIHAQVRAPAAVGGG